MIARTTEINHQARYFPRSFKGAQTQDKKCQTANDACIQFEKARAWLAETSRISLSGDLSAFTKDLTDSSTSLV